MAPSPQSTSPGPSGMRPRCSASPAARAGGPVVRPRVACLGLSASVVWETKGPIAVGELPSAGLDSGPGSSRTVQARLRLHGWGCRRICAASRPHASIRARGVDWSRLPGSWGRSRYRHGAHPLDHAPCSASRVWSDARPSMLSAHALPDWRSAKSGIHHTSARRLRWATSKQQDS